MSSRRKLKKGTRGEKRAISFNLEEEKEEEGNVQKGKQWGTSGRKEDVISGKEEGNV